MQELLVEKNKCKISLDLSSKQLNIKFLGRHAKKTCQIVEKKLSDIGTFSIIADETPLYLKIIKKCDKELTAKGKDLIKLLSILYCQNLINDAGFEKVSDALEEPSKCFTSNKSC